MTVEAVLWDLDGTLVDTAPDLVGVLNTLLATRGLPPVPFAVARNEVSNGALGLIRLGLGSQDQLRRLKSFARNSLIPTRNRSASGLRYSRGLKIF